MDNGNGIHFSNLLSEFVYVRTYARWLDAQKRRETWPETVKRYVDYYVRSNPKLQNLTFDLAGQVEQAILNKDLLPSMRSLWCAGPAVDRDHTCSYNCSFIPIDNLKAFAEALYILMCGTGVGFSVERTFVDCLPKVAALTEESTSYVVEDSTEGWADSLHYALVEGHRGHKVWFDYSKVRPKGARLRIKGGTASGPEPLERVHKFVAETLEAAAGRRLKPIEAHDIMCMIAEIVMVGGFRRASLISFSDPDDIEMRHAKDWRQGNVPAIRYMANNSAVWFERPSIERFREEWQNLVDSGSGERGFSIMNWNKRAARNTENIRSNPCHEVGLRFKRALNPWTGEGGGAQFCNLTAAVVRPWDTQQTLAHKVRLATWLGCIQASYTHFPYLRPAWKQLCDEDRLLGVDLTGQCDNPELTNNEGVLTSLNTVARMTAAHVSMILDINEPVAITCGKPSGNCRPWWSLTTTNRGLLTFRELLADHEDGQKWCAVKQSWTALRNDGTAHKVLRTYDNGMSKLVRLNMLYGLSVESTPEHRWFVKYRLVGRKQIAVNDWVAAKDIAVNDVLDVQLGVYNNTNSAALKAARSRAWGIAQSAKPIKMPATMSEDLGWLLGYLWGDGALSPGGYRLRFTDENRFNLEKVQRILSELFDLEAPIRQHKPNCFNIEIASVQLWHWLVNNGVFKYAMDGSLDIIPQAVRASSQADIIAFIAGLIDSDGWAGAKRKGEGLHSFTITTANSMFAKHLQDVAWSVGIGIGRSLNSLGKNLQTQKEMYLLGAVSQMLPEAFEVLRRNSNKLQRTATDASFVDWEWRAAERAYHVGRITAVEELAPEPTFDVEVDVDHWYFAGAVRSHNSSQLVDCSSGFHPRYAPYYFRHVRVSSKDPLFKMIRDYGVPVFKENGQEHLPDDEVDVWVARFPVKAPEHAMLRDHETALEQCERYLRIMCTWCGIKGHNQSATIYVRPNEWWDVGTWLYKHFDEVTGLSFLPHSDADTKYRLLPYQEITKEQYEEALAELPELDFSNLRLYETDDEGEGASEPACVGGACEL